MSRDWLGQTTSSVDARGRLSVMTYSAGGRLATTALASGPATEYRYDAIGNPTRVISVAGGETRETKTDYVMTGHDAQYKPSRITDALGNVTTLTYDSYGELASTQDAEGRTTTFSRTYATDGLLTVTKTDGTGASSTSVFSAGGRLLSTTDARGVKTVSTYNSAGRLISVRSGAAATTDGKPALAEEVRFQYDARGRVSRVIDAAGRPSDSAYDTQDRLVQSRDAAGRTVDRTYDENGKLLSERVAGSAQRSEWSYDAQDRLVSTRVYQSGQLITASTFRYDSLGRALSTETFARGERHSVTREFDNASSDPFAVRREYDDRGRETLYTYDALGALASVAQSGLSPLSYTRSGWGEVLVEQRAGAAGVSRTYDALGRVVSLSEAGKTESRTYDKTGRIRTETDFAGKTTTYAYDTVGRLVSVARANPNDGASFGYLPGGLLASVSDALGTTSYDYDAANKLTSRSRAGLKTQYTRAPGGSLARIEQQSLLGGGPVRLDIARDLNQLPKTLSTNTGNTFSFTRDALQRLTSLNADSVWRTSFEHRDGELARSFSDGPVFTTENVLRREDGKRSSRTQTMFFKGWNGTVREAETFSYHPMTGQLSESTYDYTDTGEQYGAGRTFTHPSDARGNLTRSPDGLTPLSVLANDELTGTGFTADAAGNTTHVELESGQSWDFEYDSANRLAVSRNEGFTTRYRYDGNGNLLRQTLEHPNGKIESTDFVVDESGGFPRITAELRSDGTEVHYVYGENGPLLERTLRPGKPEVQRYALSDELGSLRAWTKQDGNWSEFFTRDPYGNVIDHFGSEAVARRFSLVTSNRNAGRTSGAVVGRAFNFVAPDFVLAAADADGQTPSLKLTLADGSKGSCVYAPSSTPGTLKRTLVGCTSTTGTALTGMLKLTRFEFQPMSGAPDSAELRMDLVERLPDGTPAPRYSGLGFAGEWTGPDGTVFLRARHYLPAIGRFLQRDSFAGLEGSSLSRNRFAYAQNQPLDLVDPSGHFPKAFGAARDFKRGMDNYGLDAFFGLGPALVNGAAMSRDGWDLLIRSMAETVTGGDQISGWRPTGPLLTPLTADALGLVDHNNAAESLGYNTAMTVDTAIGVFQGGRGILNWGRAEVAALRAGRAGPATLGRGTAADPYVLPPDVELGNLRNVTPPAAPVTPLLPPARLGSVPRSGTAERTIFVHSHGGPVIIGTNVRVTVTPGTPEPLILQMSERPNIVIPGDVVRGLYIGDNKSIVIDGGARATYIMLTAGQGATTNLPGSVHGGHIGDGGNINVRFAK